jgi:hypothetical protein
MNYSVGHGIRHNYLDLHLGQEGANDFCSMVELDLPFLPSESPRFRSDGQPADAGRAQGFSHRIELEWFYDRFYLCHYRSYLLDFVMLKSG